MRRLTMRDMSWSEVVVYVGKNLETRSTKTSYLQTPHHYGFRAAQIVLLGSYRSAMPQLITSSLLNYLGFLL